MFQTGHWKSRCPSQLGSTAFPSQNEIDYKYLLSFNMFDQCNDNTILLKEHIQMFDEINFCRLETNYGIYAVSTRHNVAQIDKI